CSPSRWRVRKEFALKKVSRKISLQYLRSLNINSLSIHEIKI
ncbi:unnamed protein product, partial [marine sediment metagenome]